MGANGSTAASCSSLDISESQRRRRAQQSGGGGGQYYDGQYRNLQHNQHEQRMLKYRKQQQAQISAASHNKNFPPANHRKLKQSSSYFDLSAIATNHQLDHQHYEPQTSSAQYQQVTSHQEAAGGKPQIMTSNYELNNYASGKPVMVLPSGQPPALPVGRLIHAKKSNAGVASKILQHRQQKQQQQQQQQQQQNQLNKKFSDSLPSLNNIILTSPQLPAQLFQNHTHQSPISPLLLDQQAISSSPIGNVAATSGGGGGGLGGAYYNAGQCHQMQGNRAKGGGHLPTALQAQSSAKMYQPSQHIRGMLSPPAHVTGSHFNLALVSHSPNEMDQSFYPNNQRNLSPQRHYHRQPQHLSSSQNHHNLHHHHHHHQQHRNSNHLKPQQQQQFMKRATSLSSLHNIHNLHGQTPTSGQQFGGGDNFSGHTNDYEPNQRHNMSSRPPVAQKVLSSKNNNNNNRNNHLTSAMIQQHQFVGHSRPLKPQQQQQLANGMNINRPESMNSNYDYFYDPLHGRQSLSSAYLGCFESANGRHSNSNSLSNSNSNQSPAPMANNNNNHHQQQQQHGGKTKLHKFKQAVASGGAGHSPSRYKSKSSKHQLTQTSNQQQQGCPVLPPLPRSQSLHELIQLRATENGQRMRNTGTLRGPLNGQSDGQPASGAGGGVGGCGAKVNLVAELLESRRQQKLTEASQPLVVADGSSLSTSSQAAAPINVLSGSQCSSSDDGIHDISLSAGEHSNSATTTSCASSSANGQQFAQGRPAVYLQQPVSTCDDKRRRRLLSQDGADSVADERSCHQSASGQGRRRNQRQANAAAKYQPGKSTLKRSLSHSALQQSLVLDGNEEAGDGDDDDESDDLNELAKFLYQFKQRQAAKSGQLAAEEQKHKLAASQQQQQIKLANQSVANTTPTSGADNSRALAAAGPLTTTNTTSSARQIIQQQQQQQQQQSPSSTTSSSGFASSTCGTSNSISSANSSDDCNNRVTTISGAARNGIDSQPINISNNIGRPASRKKYPAPPRPDIAIYRSETNATGNISGSQKASPANLISGKLKLSSSLLSIVDEYNNNNNSNNLATSQNNINTLQSAKSNYSQQQTSPRSDNCNSALMGGNKFAREQAEQTQQLTGGCGGGGDEDESESNVDSLCQLEQLKRYTQLRQMSQSELALNHLTSSAASLNLAAGRSKLRNKESSATKQPYKSRLINLIRRISDKSSSSVASVDPAAVSSQQQQHQQVQVAGGKNKSGQSISSHDHSVGGQQQQQSRLKYQVNGKRGEQKGLPTGGAAEFDAINQSHMISANLNQSKLLMNGNFRRHESSNGVKADGGGGESESEVMMRLAMDRRNGFGKTRAASEQQAAPQSPTKASGGSGSGRRRRTANSNGGRASCSGHNNEQGNGSANNSNNHNNRRLAASSYLSESLCDLNFDCDFELIKNCGQHNAPAGGTTEAANMGGGGEQHNRATGGAAPLLQHQQPATGAPPLSRSSGQLVAAGSGDAALVVGAAAANHRKLEQKQQQASRNSSTAINSHSGGGGAPTSGSGGGEPNKSAKQNTSGNWRLAPTPLSLVVQPTASATSGGCLLLSSSSTTSNAATTSCLGGVIQSVAGSQQQQQQQTGCCNDRGHKSSSGCGKACKSNHHAADKSSSSSSSAATGAGAAQPTTSGGVGSKLRWLMNSGAKKKPQQEQQQQQVAAAADGKTPAAGKSRLAKLISSSGTQADSSSSVARPSEVAPGKSGSRAGKVNELASANGQQLMRAGDNNNNSARLGASAGGSPADYASDQLTNEADQLLVELDQSLDLVSKRASHNQQQQQQHGPFSRKAAVSWWKSTGGAGNDATNQSDAAAGIDASDAYDAMSRIKLQQLVKSSAAAEHHRGSSGSELMSASSDCDLDEDGGHLRRDDDSDPDSEDEEGDYASLNRAMMNEIFDVQPASGKVLASLALANEIGDIPRRQDQQVSSSSPSHSFTFSAPNSPEPSISLAGELMSSSAHHIARQVGQQKSEAQAMNGEHRPRQQVNGHSRVQLDDASANHRDQSRQQQQHQLQLQLHPMQATKQTNISTNTGNGKPVAAANEFGKANKGSCLQVASKFECATPTAESSAVIVNSSSSPARSSSSSLLNANLNLDQNQVETKANKTNTAITLANNHGGKMVVESASSSRLAGDKSTKLASECQVRAEITQRACGAKSVVDNQATCCSGCCCANNTTTSGCAGEQPVQSHCGQQYGHGRLAEGVRVSGQQQQQQQQQANGCGQNLDNATKKCLRPPAARGSSSDGDCDAIHPSYQLRCGSCLASESGNRCQVQDAEAQRKRCSPNCVVGRSDRRNVAASSSGVLGVGCCCSSSSSSSGKLASGVPIQGHSDNGAPTTSSSASGVNAARCGHGNNQPIVCHGVTAPATGCRCCNDSQSNSEAAAAAAATHVAGSGIGVKRNTTNLTNGSPPSSRICILDTANNGLASEDNRRANGSGQSAATTKQQQNSSSKCSGCGNKCQSSVSGTSGAPNGTSSNCKSSAAAASIQNQLVTGDAHQSKVSGDLLARREGDGFFALTGDSHVNNGNEMRRQQQQQPPPQTSSCPVANGNKCPQSSCASAVNNKLITVELKTTAAAAGSNGNAMKKPTGGCHCCSLGGVAAGDGAATNAEQLDDKSSSAGNRMAKSSAVGMGKNMPSTTQTTCGCDDNMGTCLANFGAQQGRCDCCSVSSSCGAGKSDKIITPATPTTTTNNLLATSTSGGACFARKVANHLELNGCAANGRAPAVRDNLISAPARQQQVAKCSDCLIGGGDGAAGKVDQMSKVARISHQTAAAATTNAICRSNSELASGCNNLVTSRTNGQASGQVNIGVSNGISNGNTNNRKQQQAAGPLLAKSHDNHLMLFGKLRNSLLSAGNSSSSRSAAISPLGKTSQKLASSQISLASSGLVAHLGARGKLYNDGTFIVKSEQKAPADNFDDNFILRRKTPNAGLKSHC